MANEIRVIEKRDLVHLAVLAAIAIVIGVYLIASTVLIAPDGVFYIERAKQLASDPVSIIKTHPPGYPFLILIAHGFAVLLGSDSSVQSWIYSAQGMTLLCRLLALIPLYFTGKLLVGGKNSFWASLILIFLPFPTRLVCDVVREWSYLLPFAAGFFFLLWGAKYRRPWVFGLVGLSSGLGYLIRPESAQLVLLAAAWLIVSSIRSTQVNKAGWKPAAAFLLLFVGFAAPVVPYSRCTGRVVPKEVEAVLKSFWPLSHEDEVLEPVQGECEEAGYTAGIGGMRAIDAVGAVLETSGQSLMWFFVPALVIGLYKRFRYEARYEEVFLITAFILLNTVLLTCRYCFVQEHISARWTLSLVMLTVFYVPVGLQTIAGQLAKKRSKIAPTSAAAVTDRTFLILALIGISACLPKLLTPVRTDKKSYRAAAEWICQNTAGDDIIASPDPRISFYAGRQNVTYLGSGIPRKGDYIVQIVKDDDIAPPISQRIKRVFAAPAIDKNPAVLVYRLGNYINENVSFVDFKWKNMAKAEYEFTFLFEVHETFEKPFRIKLRATVKEQDTMLLPPAERHETFVWLISPEPPMTAWARDKQVEIRAVVTAQPLCYRMVLDFPSEEKSGRLIDLGWIDLSAEN